MKIIVSGITDEGLVKLQELLDSPFNADKMIQVDEFHESPLRDGTKRTRVEISLPNNLAIKAGHIIEAVWGDTVAIITLP